MLGYGLGLPLEYGTESEVTKESRTWFVGSWVAVEHGLDPQKR